MNLYLQKNERLKVFACNSDYFCDSSGSQGYGVARTPIPLRQPLCFLGLRVNPNESESHGLDVPAKSESRARYLKSPKMTYLVYCLT
jgi:hypothetical protein